MPFNLYCVLYFQLVYHVFVCVHAFPVSVWIGACVCVQAIPVTLLDTSHTFICYSYDGHYFFCDVCIAVDVCNLIFCALCAQLCGFYRYAGVC
jgi:hypothetical protein